MNTAAPEQPGNSVMVPGHARYHVGRITVKQARASHDDIVRTSDGKFFGYAADF
jgi:hypothetical protein